MKFRVIFAYAAGSVNISAPDYFSEGLSPGLMSLVNCSGMEKGIIECDHMKNLQGITCDPAGVVCQGIYFADQWPNRCNITATIHYYS